MVRYNEADAILSRIAEAFQKRLKVPAEVTLAIDISLGEFCGKIENGVISAGSYGQLLDTAGRFLRNPTIENGVFCSCKEVSGIYFATHFNNYLDAAPLEEVYEYLTDLAFWGMNHFQLWFDMHHYRNMEEGKAQAERLNLILTFARSLGIKTCLCVLANEAFADSVESLRADWTCGHDGYIYELNDHYHLEICPSKPGGMELIKDYRRQMLEFFRDAQPDYVSFGAYDQGGCSCSACAPWGANGFLRVVEELIPVFKEVFPNAEFIISSWQFDTFTGTNVEYEGLAKAFEEGLEDIRYLVAEPQYATYPFTHDMHRPIIGFPEISMYQATPWGGYGANPLPGLIQTLWQRDGAKLAGGFPYSEGLYEDINKVMMLRLYRDGQPPEDTIREYLAYECGLGGEMLEKACRAIVDMEETLEREWDRDSGEHRYVIKRPEKAETIEKTMKEVHESLSEEVRQSKRWRLLYLRALIDGELVRSNFERNERVLSYFKELVALLHLQNSGKYTKPDIDA